MSATWKVSCSPAMAWRVVSKDQLRRFQQDSPSSSHMFWSIVTPAGSGLTTTGDPWLIQGPLPMSGVGVPAPSPRTRSVAMSTPDGRATVT